MLSRHDSTIRFLAARGLNIALGLELSVRIHRRGEPQGDKGTAYRIDGYDPGYDYWIDSPEAADEPATYPLEIYCHSIGSTGRDWQTGQSLYVAYDFDAITGHAAGVGVTDEQLDMVRRTAESLPYVEVRRSTGGGGLHLYVYLDGVVSADPTDDPKTARHKHAAVARAVLQKMSLDTGFAFADSVDVLGQNTWFWSVRATPENQGLAIIKPHTAKLTESDIPLWRDHIDVTSRRRSKVRCEIDVADDQSPLTDRHRADMRRWQAAGYTTIWVADHHLCQTHTSALQAAEHQGIYQTVSDGADPGHPNAFAFPLPDRGWKVYRFGATKEAATWTHDAHTWCLYDVVPDLAAASTAAGGIEDGDRGGFVFRDATAAIETARAIGQTIELPDQMEQRESRLKIKDGKLVAYVAKRDGDEGMAGWLAKKDNWVRVIGPVKKATQTKRTLPLRVLISPTHEEAGTAILSHAGTWDFYRSDSKIKAALVACGLSPSQATAALGDALFDRWMLVNEPFGPPYLPGKKWNLHAAQYAVTPAEGEHPTYDLILAHVGQNLTPAVSTDHWCRDHGILTGAHYLMHWAASALRHPFEPLPYLLLYGPEDCGKSSYGDMFGFLMSRGAVNADRALTNDANFNGELEGCIIARVEETDLSASSVARNRMKSYVTSKTLAIRRMRTNQYTVRSTLHWIQTANDADYGNIPEGDTRAVCIFVPPLKEKIKRELFEEQLAKEAPHFLQTLLSLELASTGRLRLPVLTTREKKENSAPLTDYIDARLDFHPGAKIAKDKVYADYQAWCAATDAIEMTDVDFGRRLVAALKARHIPFSGAAKVTEDGERKNAYQGAVIGDCSRR